MRRRGGQHEREQDPQAERRRCLEAPMTVGVLFVWCLRCMPCSKPDQHVRQQIRSRVDTVGDQCRGVRDQAHEYLRGTQRQVDCPANEGHLAGCLATLGALLMYGVGMLDMWRGHQDVTRVSPRTSRRPCTCPNGNGRIGGEDPMDSARVVTPA